MFGDTPQDINSKSMTISNDPADSSPFPLHTPPPPPPDPLRLNENQASSADLQEEVKESTNKHRQDPELAAIWETLVRIEPNAKFLFNKKKTWQGNCKEAT